MNYRTFVLKLLSVYLIFVQLSCKKTTDSTPILYSQKPVEIGNAYQKDIALNCNEKCTVKSIIYFSAKYSSPNLWKYKSNLKKSGLVNFNVLTNENIVSVIANIENENNIVPFILVLDKNGNELYKQNICDEISEYYFSESWISDNYDGGFTFYVKKRINLGGNKIVDDYEKKQNIKYEIEKMVFKEKGSGYFSESISIRDVVFKAIINNGFAIKNNSFSIYYLKDKIFISGAVKGNNENEFPFVAILDKNFKLLNFNVFKDYENTFITDVTLYEDSQYYINGIKVKETDLYTKKTLQRFIVNENLKVIEDHSDKRTPYYDRINREPSSQEEKILKKELAEDISELENQNKYNTIYNTRGNSNTVINPNIFYWDTCENCYYSINKKDSESNQIEFNKIVNDVNLWQIEIEFSKDCEVASTPDNTIGLKLTNGDFALVMVVENPSLKYLFSTVIFVFNSRGQLNRQFEILGASNLLGVKESKRKLIISYIHDDGFFINGKWKKNYVFCSESYLLD